MKNFNTKVLHVASHIDARSGGPVSAIAGLAVAQREIGLDVSLVASWKKGTDLALAEELRSCGIQIHLIGPCLTSLQLHPKLAGTLKNLMMQTDILHIHGIWEEIQHRASRIARHIRVPYLFRPCGMLDPWSLAQRKQKKRLYMTCRLRSNLDHAAGIHYTSQMECELTSHLNLKAPAIVEPNGINLSEFEILPPPGTFRNRFSIATNRPLLVFLGRIHPGKGLEYLIPSLTRIPIEEVLLIVVGPDSKGYRTTIENMINRMNLQEKVIFTGMLRGRERVAALADADLFVLPSDHENFGIAVIEALAAGTPAIISDQVGIQHEIRNAGVGAVVPTVVESLAEEITCWLKDEKRRRSTAECARLFVWENYNWQNIAKRWSDRYIQMINQAKSASPLSIS